MLGKGSKIYCKFSGNLMNKVMTEKWVEIQEKQNLQFVLSEFELLGFHCCQFNFYSAFGLFLCFISRHFWLRDCLMTYFPFLFNKFSPNFSLVAPAKPKKQSILLPLHNSLVSATKP